MTTSAANALPPTGDSAAAKPQGFVAEDRLGPFRSRRLPFALACLVLALMPGELGRVTRGLMTDAYVQVAAFVAVTLMLFYGAEKLFRFDIGQGLKGARLWQVPIAALLGATPGCGGAVIVVAAYSSGNVGFGAVVATLTATMGDAAFLLIATKPEVALILLPIQFSTGVLSGWLVDAFHRKDYRGVAGASCDMAPRIGRVRARDWAYLGFVIPGLALGLMQATQTDVGFLGPWPMIIGLGGTAIGLFTWATSPLQAMTNPADRPVTRMTEETSFIAVWVIGAYLAYDYIVAFGGLDLETLFGSVAILLPLAGVLVGFIPGCGPQVLVTTLYVNGLIPFGALIGNAISNDGDALFPAIALNPRAAVVATAYSAIPALILAYGFHLIAPGFLSPF
ncbi:putative manganese transporter [Frigidibacter sp. ROC022]|uniref:putative manganese transporter n=1 Tax=Frigidibacter sp. ROC022 TaxID=2971796 RepID=UPI00215AC5D5|nr:putative manganese transporter [Frigidibacter sp. ROC022]MCR8723149.1 putative manganese transporter [Frigidibacter sp. ROC022]